MAAANATTVSLNERFQERKEREETALKELSLLRDRCEQLAERERGAAAELARAAAELAQRTGELEAAHQHGRDLRVQLDASAARERDLARELARREAELAAANKAHEGELERARLTWQLEARKGDKSR